MNLGLQEPPKDPMIYNRRQADGTFRPLKGFWEREAQGNMTKTAQVLQAMLTENTGTHILDSGGAYGRRWQENQGRDFAAEPAATISIEEGYIDIRRSTFHFLNECLEFDEDGTGQFYEFCEAFDPEDYHAWLTLMEEFVAWLGDFDVYGEGPPEVTGIYGEGPPITVNTYNHDSLLDQVIQYVYFELDDKGYVILQIHGGCDVRGGYTKPKAFRCNIEASPSIFDDAEATITCKGGECHRWYVQDGRWEVDHYESADARFLTEFPIVEEETELDKIFSDILGLPHLGALWQDSSGVHCPLCGEILEVW